MKLTGAGVATFSAASLFNLPFAKAQDMSNGANNFYTSDQVTLEKVAFKSQYQANVAGNLLLPRISTAHCGIRLSSSAIPWAR
ncbi:hypothetical protein [Mesorhizobium sp.]|uniref:hypothetical protein n=1 Tax=Mesorhizobium sp. TaxID=1871066 RepID=UPI00257F0100|nr:hypothetical protein [Mesorhizobium sp.]